MNAAEFMAALCLVEEDHQLVLDKVRGLKDALSRLLEPGAEGLSGAVSRLRELYEYFTTRFIAHLEEEEETLFPLLERDGPEGVELTARLRLEHAEIRRKLEELGNCLSVAAELEGGLPRPVLRDLITDGWELWGALDDHAHAETRALQEAIDRSLLAEPVVARA
jgi:hypothetical protein